MSLDIVYTAAAHATGGGRDGHVRSEDDRLDLDTRPPKEMGGSGEGTNPEQLFAAGYAACFLGALHAAGRELDVDTTGAEVSAEVGIGGTGNGGFGLAVELDVYAPAARPEQRRRLAERAHEICPYSNATRGNITVALSIVD
ncbi:organic hydroperoxide resistance protein [Curtobacterium sp. SORGH_AS_0776]|uniref:organic hydroperoxide resistance protein n=1 Tax=Curtobacterium sp. SORGH_AS_0776 TaxID=3041798 RepID=UPI0028598AB9|nr:organic hydroperoxide resistance protein [Curtobacterium sp. SORGH_AS_0776]MDR6170274.1 osmotically inducible protein OsmC [Curtobacterium sp. SORGH_AS_0776]